MSGLIIAAVLVAGALGATVRYLTTVLLADQRALPWAIAAVNIVGSVIAGLVIGLDLSAELTLIALTGFCGGLTTFSTVTTETVQLLGRGRVRTALASLLLSLSLGILGCAAGVAAGLAVASTLA